MEQWGQKKLMGCHLGCGGVHERLIIKRMFKNCCKTLAVRHSIRPVRTMSREVHVVFLRSVRRLLVTANVAPSSPILVTLMMEALSSYETSVLTRVTRRKIPEDGILHSHRRENLKSYIALTGWTL
jgi:hypothetical protein